MGVLDGFSVRWSKAFVPRRLFVLWVVIVAVLAGCRFDPPSAAPSETPGQNAPDWPDKLSEFRFRWSAEPGLDLLSGPVVPLRAYLESWLLTYFTGELDVVYPGFQRATPPLVQFQSSDWRALPYARRAVSGHQGSSDFNEPGLQILGNEDLHILKLDPMPSGFRAFVCDSRFGMYKRTEGTADFTPLRAESSVGAMVDIGNMSVWRVEFTAGSQSLAAQEGPLPAPSSDVFGQSFFTGVERVEAWWNADHPGLTGDEADQRLSAARGQAEALRQQCLDWLGLSPAERVRLATAVLAAPPELKPATPGWPE